MDRSLIASKHVRTPRSTGISDEAAQLITLLEAHQRDFVRFAVRRIGSRADAEDVVQTFNLKVLGRNEWPAGSKALAWLYRVLRTTLVDHYRREAARRRAHDGLAREPLAAVVEPAATPCGCIRRVLPTLRPDQQELLRRAELGSEPHASIAASFGTTVNVIGVRLHRTRRVLRDRLTRLCCCCCPAEAMACSCEARVDEIDCKESLAPAFQRVPARR